VTTVKALEGGRRRRAYPNTVAALADALGLSENERAVLVTALASPGEQVRTTPVAVPVEHKYPDELDGAVPLSVEEATRSPAVRVFADRARGASPTFALSPANVSAVAGICDRLDGLPLALELAAPRIKLLPRLLFSRGSIEACRCSTPADATRLPGIRPSGPPLPGAIACWMRRAVG
jgi:hypothetical protein